MIEESVARQKAFDFLQTTKQRLDGIFNYTPRNYGRGEGQKGRNIDVSDKIPLSVEGHVHRLIKEASSEVNLAQMYVGWMPWL